MTQLVGRSESTADWPVRDWSMHLGGHWMDAIDGSRHGVSSPATGEALGTVAWGDRADAQRAIAAAAEHRASVSRLSVLERSNLCHAVADEVSRRHDELTLVLALEQGKPRYKEADREVTNVVLNFRQAGEEALRLGGETIPARGPSKRVQTFRQARGIYAVITPWNFPMNIPTHYLSAGIATGNSMVWVPSKTTSIAAVYLMECIEAAGVPAGMVNLVLGPGSVVGDEVVSNPGTQAVGFTGSPEVGRRIAQRAAGKPLLLELGGNGPTVVLADADLDHAAEAAALACFFNAGQSCSATERIVVERTVHESFMERLVTAAQKYPLGSPLERETVLGPLNNEQVAAKMDSHISDAVEHGAQVVVGGSRAAEAPTQLYYEATVLDRVPRQSAVNHEETFGPIAPVVIAADEDDALDIAKDASLGLTAAVFTRNISTAFRFAEDIRAGIVNINDHSNYWESHIPFGGVAGTQSGIGRLGGRNTMLEMTDVRTIIIDVDRR